MATRCNVRIFKTNKVRKPDFILYHHCDGHPGGVGACLEEFISENFKYCLYSDYLANALLKWSEDDGYRIATEMAGDIDYYYDIFCDERMIRCYRCERRSENGKIVHVTSLEYERIISYLTCV